MGSMLAFTTSMVMGAVTGVAADRIWGRASEYWSHRPEATFERFERARGDAVTFDRVTETLRPLYGNLGHELLELRSGTYPCVVFPSSADDPDALFSPLLSQPGELRTDLVSDPSYRHAIGRRVTTPLFDGGVYPMVSLEPEVPVLNCRHEQTGYFAVLDTCVSLEYEAFLVASSSRGSSLRSDKLKLRHKLHSSVSDPVLSGEGRMAGVGGSTVLVYWDGTDYRAVVPQRSRSGVAASRGLFAVAPTFMVQALHGSAHAEFSVSYNVMREYCEELQDLHLDSTVDPQSVIQSNCYLDLAAMLADGRASHTSLGVAVNLLELRADACTLLVIHDEEWAKTLRLSDEFSTHRQFLNTPRITELLDTLESDGLPYAPHEIVPACAGALWMALSKLELRPELLVNSALSHV